MLPERSVRAQKSVIALADDGAQYVELTSSVKFIIVGEAAICNVDVTPYTYIEEHIIQLIEPEQE